MKPWQLWPILLIIIYSIIVLTTSENNNDQCNPPSDREWWFSIRAKSVFLSYIIIIIGIQVCTRVFLRLLTTDVVVTAVPLQYIPRYVIQLLCGAAADGEPRYRNRTMIIMSRM